MPRTLRKIMGALLPVVAFFIFTPSVLAAPAFVQTNFKEVGSGKTDAVAFSSNNTAGNTIVVYVIWSNTNAVALTDTRGNSYVNASGPVAWGGNKWNAQIFYAKNIAGGANTVTATFTTSINSFAVVYVHEYSGVDTLAPIDASKFATGNSGTLNTGTLTTVNANDLLFAAGASDRSVTGISSNFTRRSNGSGNITEDRTVNAVGNYSATATQNGNLWVMQLVALKASNPQPDITPPTVPSNLTASAISASQINLNWSASTDAITPQAQIVYTVYRNGVKISTTTPGTSSYSDTGLSSNTSYTYTITATDQAGNNSAQSAPATATTPFVDVQAPTTPTNLIGAGASISQVGLSWTASTDNVGVTGYNIFKNGVKIATTPITSYTVSGLTVNTQYTFAVSAYDAAGNTSAQAAVLASTLADTTPPQLSISSPTNNATVSGLVAITASSTDDVGVVGVQFTVDGVNLGAEDTTLPYATVWDATNIPNGNHTITATSRDAAGNINSATITVTVNNADITPPLLSGATPTGTLQAGTTSAQLQINTNEPATCRYATVPNTTYAQMVNTFTSTGNIAHTTLVNGLIDGSSYTYYVRCSDASGNATTNDYPITFSVGQITITVSPAQTSVSNNSTQQFTCTVTGANDTSCTWSLQEQNTDATLIATSSSTATYTAPSTATGTYHVIATSVANNQKTATASVTVSNLNFAFPLAISANKRFLQDQNGKPFPIMGRTAWLVISLPQVDYQKFIANTVAHGYNSIEMQAITHDYVRTNHPPFDGNNNAPFLKRLDGNAWNGSLVYGNISAEAPDFTTPNEAYWSNMDTFLSYCQSQGIEVFLFPAYVGYSGAGAEGYMQEMVANGTNKMQTYGAWIANRYKNYKNIVWMAGGDYSAFSGSQIDVENSLIAGMKSVPNQQSVYMSAEWSTGIATDQVNFGNQMTLNGAYSWADVINQSRRAYAYGTMPAFLLEEPYDQEGPDGTNVDNYSTQPVRRYQWYGWLSTIGGTISGNGYIWPFLQGWDAPNHLDSAATSDMTKMFTFINSINWYQLVPSGLGNMKNLIPSNNGVSDIDTVVAAANPDGSLLVAYTPPGHNGTFSVDMTALSGTAQASWFNPSTGVYTNIGSLNNVGTQVFTPPGDNGSGYHDWVLVLNATPIIDNQAPTVPANISAVGVSPTQINLSWSASTDNVGVTSYSIFRGGVFAGATVGTSFNDTGLTPNTSYSYTISASDNAGNVSALSAPVVATTQAQDITPPTVPANLAITGVTASSLTLSWSASTDASGVAGYHITRNGSVVATLAQTTYNDSGLTPNTLYTYSVNAFDGAGNTSAQSLTVNTTTPASLGTVPAIFKQQNYATPQTNQSTVSVSYSSNQTAGNTNIIAVGWGDMTANITSLTDSAGNVYQIAAPTYRGNGYSQAIYYAQNIKAGANTVTVKFDVPAVYVDLRATEYAGLSTGNPVDAAANGTGNSTNATTANLVTTGTNDLLFAAGETLTAFTAAGPGYTVRVITQPNTDLVEDRNAATAGTYSASAPNNPSGGWVLQLVAFKPLGL